MARRRLAAGLASELQNGGVPYGPRVPVPIHRDCRVLPRSVTLRTIGWRWTTLSRWSFLVMQTHEISVSSTGLKPLTWVIPANRGVQSAICSSHDSLRSHQGEKIRKWSGYLFCTWTAEEPKGKNGAAPTVGVTDAWEYVTSPC